MTFDQMYDEMLDLEFSTPGRHTKADTISDPAAAAEDICAHARHAKPDAVEADAEAGSERERPTGLARYRTAALVGAGGLACATVGALLGGLGGYFTVSPAGAHAVGSTSQNVPWAGAVDRAAQGAHSAAAHAALAGTPFSSVSGGLTQGGGLGSITANPPSNSPVQGGLPASGGPIPGGSSGSTGGTTGGTNGGNAPAAPLPGDPTPPPPCTTVLGLSCLPSLPVPTPTVPLPITTPTVPLPVTTPTVPLPVTTPTVPTTVTSPTVPLPLPTAPSTTTLGPVSVSTTSGSGSTTSGLTLNLG